MPTAIAGCFESLLDGRRFELAWIPGSKAGPEGLRIATLAGPVEAPPRLDEPAFAIESPYRGEPWPTAQSPAPLLIRAENTRDRLGKLLRLNREIQLGDPLFDRRVYIESDAPDHAISALLRSPHARAALLSCLELGVPNVTLEQTGDLVIEVRGATAPSIPRLLDLLRALGAAASALPQLRGRAPQRRAWISLAMGLGGLLGTGLSFPALAAADWGWEPVDGDIFLAGAVAGVAVWLLSIPVVFFAVRGRSASLRDFVICTTFPSVGWPVALIALLILVNGALDSSAPEPHACVVARRYTTTGKSTKHYLVLDPADGVGRRYELSVSVSTYLALRESSPAVVTTRSGALGYEWLVSVGSGR